ncbi:helix-turn-helix domain-containing protein [Pseudonocardia endophytica]|uniref:GAF domain-containing protein n=1 Tax=Pseudonocardia endophytica TaxID=401976 RepID=A0A4R1HVD0_PSEEN|nr:helix-turn-helix domain-containing protein [Pseudonocardia endophytica]TCK21432.1 GAF domain-containing protein [Pseudonocardia endophytica]
MTADELNGEETASSDNVLDATPTGPLDLASLVKTVPRDGPSAASALAPRAALAIGAPVTVALWAQNRWTVVAGAGTGLAGLPADGPPETTTVDRPGMIVSAGGTAALCWAAETHVDDDTHELLLTACAWLSLRQLAQSAREQVDDAEAEAAALREVFRQLLSVRDLDQVLHSIAERTLRLLDSDICGVLLRDDNVVRMRACVGNRATETARLVMHRGQGVAGLVFLTGEPAKVDTYLEDRTISDDFMSLAAKEETRSAMAVPLRLQGELVGVLEVWRRRRSVFTERDQRRMVTFADFASIAIDNARLYDEQAAAARESDEARAELQRQLAVLDGASRLQHQLLQTVIEGGGLTAVTRSVAAELDCEIGVYGPDGGLLAAHSGRHLQSTLPAVVPPTDSSTRTGRSTNGNGHAIVEGDHRTWARPVYADGDRIGQVLVRQDLRVDAVADAVVGQVAMACSLALLRERAASRARAEATEQVLWDLLHGPVEHRLAARSRAQQLNVSLAGDLRVLHARIANVETLAAELGWDTSQTDRARRQVLRTVRTLEGRELALVSLRGDLLVAVAADLDRVAARAQVEAYSEAIHQEWPALELTWGVSRAHRDVLELPTALDEARTALAAAKRLGGQSVFFYEELGIIRLLLGSGNDPDLHTFLEEVTGPLVAYDRDHDGALIATMRAFFDADCSQRVASERLFVHHKTLRYRLERIRQLTGLDLSRHDDRMRADFALRLLQVSQAMNDNDTDPPEFP